MRKTKKISKYVVGTIAISAIGALAVSTAVGCSSNNSTATSSSNNQSSSSTTALAVMKATKSDGTDYYAPFNSSLTLNATSSNLPNRNVTYSWYCNNALISSQTTTSSLAIKVLQTKSTYYVITYVNGIKQTTSNDVTIIPTFDASKFSAVIDANIGNNGMMQQVTSINDTKNINSYKLAYHVCYDEQIFDINPKSVNWTINDQTQTNNTSTSIVINNLKVGVNNISATSTININGKNYFINSTSLTINNYQLLISGTNVTNNQVKVAYDGSLSLNASANSIALLTSASINHLTYQWYEIANKQSQATLLNNQTTTTLNLNNITNNATYYLVASWQENNTTYNLTSNHIMVQVNAKTTLSSPMIVCSAGNTKIFNSLNLSTSNINNQYQFSIANIKNNSTVTYSLEDLTTNKAISLSNNTVASNSSLMINFNLLGLIKGNQYQLNATIMSTSTTSLVLSFTIYYDDVTIIPNNSPLISQVGNSNTYNVNEGSSITINATSYQGSATGPISYQWKISSNGTSWSNLNSSSNYQLNGSELTINDLKGNKAYFQLIETIGNLSLTSNSIEIIPVAINSSTTSNYSDIVISTTSIPYYGYDVTLTSNINNAKSYAWYLVNNNELSSRIVSTKSTYTIQGITTDQSYKLVVTSPSNKIYSSSIYEVKVNPLSNLTLSTTANLNGYATWWVNEQLTTFIGHGEFNNFINQNGIGYAIASNVTYQDFTDYKCYFHCMPSSDGFGNQQFLTISAKATNPISIATWNAGWKTDASLQVPTGSIFTWTLPYELSSLYYSQGKVGLSMLNVSDWLTSNYAPSLKVPFGLSIGTNTNPTAISGNGKYTQAINGVIGIAYGNSINDSWNAPSTWANAYSKTTQSNENESSISNPNKNSLILTTSNNSVNIASNSLITFLTNAYTIAGAVSTTSFTNNTVAINPISCTYEIIKDNNILISGNATWINDKAMVNYNFNEPGQYEIKITYTIPNLKNTTLQQTNVYYVNYNQITISTASLNPAIGSNVTLSANNTKMYASETNATYEWQQFINGSWKTVQDSSASTYDVNINVYNENYEYQLIETINGISYQSAPITLTPNLDNFNASATISSANALNGAIGITKNTSQAFNLSITCNGVTYDNVNHSSLKNVKIVWNVNGNNFSSANWTSNYAPTSNNYGNYKISATVTFTLYDKTFSNITSNVITIDYSAQIGTLTVASQTSSSPYLYNPKESKLVIWGTNESSPEDTKINFDVSGITYNSKNKYTIAFYNNSELGTTIPVNYDSSTNSFTISADQFIGYNCLQLLVNGISASQVIAYSYLPQKPWFEIAPHSTISVTNPQIILQPNESLGNATLGALTPADVSFDLEVNGTSIQISHDKNFSNDEGNATIIIDQNTNNPITIDNFYSISVLGETYVIKFNKTQFAQLIKSVDYSGSWTTIQVSTTLSNVTLNNEPISGPNPLSQIIGYANSDNSNNAIYTAGVYWNNVPVTSVPVGATNVTLQISGTNPTDKIQWMQVTSNGTFDLTGANSSSFALPTSSFASSNQILTYEAQVTTANGVVITNQCTVTVNNLGQAQINVYDPSTNQNVSENNSVYTLTSGNIYNIQTTNQSPVIFNNQNSGGSSLATYYQWQYKSNVVILGGIASHGVWTNLGNATNTYTPYQYDAIPMYSVSFRLVVFSDANPTNPITFSVENNPQYIISNTINTYAPLNCNYTLNSTASTIKQGTTVTYTLNLSNQQALKQLIESCQYEYETYNSTTNNYNQPTWFYPITVTWFFKLSSQSSYTKAATLPIIDQNGKLEFAGSDSLSYTFSANTFSTLGTYNIYAQINYTDNFNSSISNTANLTVTSTASSLNYNYETYMENAIANWINAGTNAVANTSLSGTQPQSTFNDFIQQNGAGYEVHATSQDFDNYKVSFTSTPSADSSELGSNKWLTITATATTTIDMYYWEGNNGWGAKGGITVASGSQFVWTLPYALADISYSSSTAGGMLEMALNSTYSNASSNESLLVPFGLSVGTSTDPTSISKTWSFTSNYDGVLANNYGSNGESFILPGTWVVPYSQDETAINLFANQLSTRTFMFTSITLKTNNFITNLMKNNEVSLMNINARYRDFRNWDWWWNLPAMYQHYFLNIRAFNHHEFTTLHGANKPNTKQISSVFIPISSYYPSTFSYLKSLTIFNYFSASSNAILFSHLLLNH